MREIIMLNKTYIIAEMSANHNKDFDTAKEIIKVAKAIGADAIKVQTYTADTMTINCRDDIFMGMKGSPWEKMNSYDLYKEASTPWEWQKDLKKYADSIGIDFFSTPFDKTAVDFLEGINVPKYKIASFEAIDYPLIRYCASKMKPMIISSGISSLDEIQEVIDACKAVGNNDITILKCTSSYPAKLEDMNILTIKDMIERLSSKGVKVGLSDHSMDIETVISAVALGACVIEKHLTLSRKIKTADSEFSLEPDEFKKMIESTRKTEKLLGHVSYEYSEKSRAHARSLFAVKDIKKGEMFTPENVRSIRPNNGLHPKYYDEILGKTAMCDIKFGTPLRKNFIVE